ncbi:GYDIA family GHMP kinase [Cochleicola gelatinilyticus]|uniref:GHMP kinase n=1 Tax=Cochleicola gelatinilyticus TaxID=1763537 RepID=A0A167IM69_9FLAO|nr:GYDIA family GHMP kinase [Cochleicola gelatinilyticus]OAB79813.1 GHMP kinase [Cochleicola gelatinilyticus]
MNKTFYSNGKLLLTGEYLVLDGATALSIPTRYGQSLKIHTSESDLLHWKSFDIHNAIWFEATFKNNGTTFQLHTCADTYLETAKTLLNILNIARKLNPAFLQTNTGYQISTHLDFPRNWGLGTSSTLINNIAQWAQVDAFTLLQKSFGGSGYDIASAQCNAPILYEVSENASTFREVHLPWEFTDSLFFIYLNEKKDSKEGIAHYRKTTVSEKQIEYISDLSKKLLLCYTLSEFEQLIVAHERVVSEIIGLPTLKESTFPDYPNVVKSLGAWGGDFFLATGTKTTLNYFREKGFETIVPFSEMIKKARLNNSLLQ